MIRRAMIAVACAAGCLLAAAPGGATAQVQAVVMRSGRAAVASVDVGGSERVRAVFVEPVPGGTAGYINGAGTVGTPTALGLDMTRPWAAVTVTQGPASSIACATALNLQPGDWGIYDRAGATVLRITVPCDAGADAWMDLWWERTEAVAKNTWSTSFGEGAGVDGTLGIHGFSGRSTFWVCGNVSGCRFASDPGVFWRILDGNAVARSI